ncbi:MAG: hypothetical protein JSV10_02810, partial [Candidatus Zixiibacteriota bacterium]
TPLWTETQYEVFVDQGIFNVLLSIPDIVWGSAASKDWYPLRWIGVTMGEEWEMVPRSQIACVPYAYRAGQDGDWWYPTDPYHPLIVYLKQNWGIARNSGCSVFGNYVTHTNLGISSTTGTPGENYGYCTVGGGDHNTASAEDATVSGGTYNTASWTCATVGGGGGNTASAGGATVGGGSANTASGLNATVPGGHMNTAAGSYSFACGNRAQADHSGTFVWADGTDADFASTGGNQFLIRASGGVGIGTTNPQMQLHVSGPVLADHVWRGDSAEIFSLGNTGSNTATPTSVSRRGPVMWFCGHTSVRPGAIELRYGDAGSDTPIGYLDITQEKGDSIRVRVDANGNVGIGTNDPSEILHIATGTAYPDVIQIGGYTAFGQEHSSGATVVGDNVKPDDKPTIGMEIISDHSSYGGRAMKMSSADGIAFHAQTGSVTAGDVFGNELMRITNTGNVGIGTASPQGALDVSSTTGALIVPRMTTAQRAALTAVNGMIIYNTDDNQFNFHENGDWVTK